ncbi:ribonuclease H-like domain-containing protein [Tanacetum coccineum]
MTGDASSNPSAQPSLPNVGANSYDQQLFPQHGMLPMAQQAHVATSAHVSHQPGPAQAAHQPYYPWAYYSGFRLQTQQFGTALLPGLYANIVAPPFPSQATLLLQVFLSMTPHDPSWNMDTGASSHLSDNTGKHVKFLFYSSVSSVKSVFKIIHSDIWTSPIPSESGIKYYAILLDHFSHFVWVYPLHAKSDLFDNFVAFRAYVNKQFNVDIKALQCDHEGEYDNTRFHDLFRQNGIQYRFSCPRTSQQNGKSERMLRTVNNLIRTLLFQAHIPPFYWV